MTTKRGITVSMLMVMVVVLIILTTTIVTSVSNSINNSKLSLWIQEISFVQDAMRENRTVQDAMLLGEVVFDVSSISTDVIEKQFKDETVTDGSITLYEINLAKLDIDNVVYGRHNTTNDVYAYSKTTKKVYYLEGFSAGKKQVYYTLTDELENRYSEKQENSNSSVIVFVASSVNYTNEAVQVTVRIPTDMTNINITTSNANIVVGGQTTVNDMYEYIVNTTNVLGNYEITVSYVLDSTIYTTNYVVNNYDETKPVISEVNEDNFVYNSVGELRGIQNITATDASGISTLKYAPGNIPEEQAGTYFKINGSELIGGRINHKGSITEYTIYAEDNAGNYSVATMVPTLKNVWVLEKTVTSGKVTQVQVRKRNSSA